MISFNWAVDQTVGGPFPNGFGIKAEFTYVAKVNLFNPAELLLRIQNGPNIRQALTRYVLQPNASSL